MDLLSLCCFCPLVEFCPSIPRFLVRYYDSSILDVFCYQLLSIYCPFVVPLLFSGWRARLHSMIKVCLECRFCIAALVSSRRLSKRCSIVVPSLNSRPRWGRYLESPMVFPAVLDLSYHCFGQCKSDILCTVEGRYGIRCPRLHPDGLGHITWASRQRQRIRVHGATRDRIRLTTARAKWLNDILIMTKLGPCSLVHQVLPKLLRTHTSGPDDELKTSAMQRVASSMTLTYTSARLGPGFR